jgi:hypothetical protein
MDERSRKAMMRAGIHMALALNEVLKAVQVILNELARPAASGSGEPADRGVQRIHVD